MVIGILENHAPLLIKLEETLDYYRSDIKPYIENEETRDYGQRELGNIVTAFKLGVFNPEVICMYHNGLKLLTWSELLFKKMRKNEQLSQEECLEFEAYLAQVTLAMKSGNRF